MKVYKATYDCGYDDSGNYLLALISAEDKVKAFKIAKNEFETFFDGYGSPTPEIIVCSPRDIDLEELETVSSTLINKVICSEILN